MNALLLTHQRQGEILILALQPVLKFTDNTLIYVGNDLCVRNECFCEDLREAVTFLLIVCYNVLLQTIAWTYTFNTTYSEGVYEWSESQRTLLLPLWQCKPRRTYHTQIIQIIHIQYYKGEHTFTSISFTYTL